eukprot:8407726-Pyramimonas_sp.AAC.2
MLYVRSRRSRRTSADKRPAAQPGEKAEALALALRRLLRALFLGGRDNVADEGQPLSPGQCAGCLPGVLRSTAA